jgi:hypothetical protein
MVLDAPSLGPNDERHMIGARLDAPRDEGPSD